MRRLDSSTIKKIQSLRKQGKILEEIREETGVSLGAISKYCRRVKVDSVRRMISSDPLEQELDAEVQDLAREAKRLGLEVSIARMKQNIAEIKHESTQRIDEPLEHRVPVWAPKQHFSDSATLQDVPTPLESESAVEYIADPEDFIVEVEGVPVSGKVYLSTKNLMLFDRFRTQYQWDGDLSDFVNVAMTYFFENKLGVQVQVIVRDNI